MSSKTDQLFEEIVGQLVDTIETGNHGEWEKPWTTVIAGSGTPVNPTPKHSGYHGMNELVLMVVTAIEGRTANVWATYKQWKKLGGQVRKGESGVRLVKWGVTFSCEDCDHRGRDVCPEKGHTPHKSMWASPFTVFNVDQQDGYEIELPDLGDEPTRLENVEQFVVSTGARIEHRASNSASFNRTLDRIELPLREQFDTPQGYYGTALHELTHWAGHSTRLNRKKGTTFGDADYAFEELIAELGATFLAARFGVEVEPHPEHAAYLAGWLSRLTETPRDLYSAAKQASASAEFLTALAESEKEDAA